MARYNLEQTSMQAVALCAFEKRSDGQWAFEAVSNHRTCDTLCAVLLHHSVSPAPWRADRQGLRWADGQVRRDGGCGTWPPTCAHQGFAKG